MDGSNIELIQRYIRNWRDLVNQVERRYHQDLPDYERRLAIRDVIEELLADPGTSATSGIKQQLAELDRRFFAATVERRPLKRGETGAPWQHRVPRNPVRDMAEQLASAELSRVGDASDPVLPSVVKETGWVSHVWLFTGAISFASGVFETKAAADDWIRGHRLTGMLTAYPLNTGVYDWMVERGSLKIKSDRQRLPGFIGSFSHAALPHFHYEDGSEVGGTAGNLLTKRPGAIPKSKI